MPIDIALSFTGLILLVIGIFSLPFYLYDWYKNKKLIKEGQETKGIITEALTYQNDDGLNSGQYRYCSEYYDNKENKHFVTSRFANRNPDKWLKKEVSIVYELNNPKNAFFKQDISPVREVIEYTLMICIGGLLIIIVYLFM